MACFLFSGIASKKSHSSAHSSRSASLSSVSHRYDRTLSALSRNQENVPHPVTFEDLERDEDTPTWPGMQEIYSSIEDDSAEVVEGSRNSLEQFSGDMDDSRVISPSHDSFVSRSRDLMLPSRDSVVSPSRDSVFSPAEDVVNKSPLPPRRSSSVTSRMGSPSTRSPSVQSLRGTKERSRGSSAASSEAIEQWDEAVRSVDNMGQGKSSSSSLREHGVLSRQSDLKQERSRVESDTRTSSGKSANGDAVTKATLGSEADLVQVSETQVRSQSVVDGLYEDLLVEEETADQEWPGMSERSEDFVADEGHESDESDSIMQGNWKAIATGTVST